MSLQELRKDQLGTLKLVGKPGGQGTVYEGPRLRLNTSAGSAAGLFKEYHRDNQATLNRDVLESQSLFVQQLSVRDGKWLLERASWPLVLVERKGFLMERAPARFTINLSTGEAVASHIAKVGHLCNGQAFLKRHHLNVSDFWRGSFLRDVAAFMEWLHSRDITVCDFSCNNLLFATTGPSSFYFIDCDSMALQGRTALPVNDTPEWDAPGVPGSKEVDVYKYALLVVRLFAGDQLTRDPKRAGRLPKKLQKLLLRSLAKSPSRRPTMATWNKALLASIPSLSRETTLTPTPRNRTSDTGLTKSASRLTAKLRGTRELFRKRKGFRAALAAVLIAAGAVLAAFYFGIPMSPNGSKDAGPSPDATSAVLDARVSQDEQTAEELVGKWVPQISSKTMGTVSTGTGYKASDILSDFNSSKGRYSQALLLSTNDYTTYRTADYFVTVVGPGFSTGKAANQWCQKQGLSSNECFAVKLSHSGNSEGKALHWN